MILTVDVALALICLRHKQVGNMSSDPVLIGYCVSTKHFLQSAHSQHFPFKRLVLLTFAH